MYITQNRLGERKKHSVVSFSSDKKVFLGEDTISQNIGDYKNTI